MTRHRWRFLALLALLLAALVAGCGGDDDDDDEGGAGTTTEAAEDVSGSVSIAGIWIGEEQASFRAVIDGFREQYPDVEVKYNAAGDNLPTVLSTAVEGGNPPDLAAIAQPGLMQDFVTRGALKPLDFAREAAVENFGESVVETGSVDGQFYGLFWKANNKSTIWYNVNVFEDALGADAEAPETWAELVETAQTIKASGIPAFSVAGADGWTLTDLFENIYLRTAGPEKYDQLARHEIKWTDASVKEALREMAKILKDGENIAGGTSGALQTDFETAVGNVFSKNPKAAMIIEGDFVPGVPKVKLKPKQDYDFFAFPSLGGSGPAAVGSGNLVVAFNDTPAVQAFINYLTTPESAEIWVKRGGFVSPNKNLDASAYGDALLRETSTTLTEAETFRFDLSDLAPSAFGATVGQGMWKLLQDFLRNPGNVDGIARQLETAAARAYK
ncbi:MAG: extracellular solute-binding protein [Thermoleophilia bacterium]|nr:extracellular solute-binding protein [Thermoleophilia bacterium]